VGELLHRVQQLREFADSAAADTLLSLARQWYRWRPTDEAHPFAVAFVARDRAELREQLDWAARQLAESPRQALPAAGPAQFRDRIFYSPEPLGPTGQIAFVYPGSGNDF